MALIDKKTQDNPFLPLPPSEARIQRVKEVVESYKKNLKDFWVLYLHMFVAVNILFGSICFWFILSQYAT